VIGWNEQPVRDIFNRLTALHHYRPQMETVSEDEVLAKLVASLGPDRTIGEVVERGADTAIRAALSLSTRKALERLAPSQIETAAGPVRVDWSNPRRPVATLRMDRALVLAENPTVFDGDVGVELRLTSPRGRTLCMTRNLRDFWERKWPRLMSELAFRFPTHSWVRDAGTANHDEDGASEAR
jgi:ATP-dependent helicase HrpB